jgi:hypothetical protein|tara:strand:+ start:992 stop:1378 length:387 start_codon:yes stop_codon:yes gene_type:complete
MGKILTEISEGELLDKITILEIKLKEIKNQSQLKEIKKEYEILTDIKNKSIKKSEILDGLYNELKIVNKRIWDIENIKRNYEKNGNFDEKFISISRDEYKSNDQRAKIKSEINSILDSNIKEVKQHDL